MLLEIDGLTKTYRHGVRANDGISLTVEAGEVFGLLGHNGAGKTTLVNQVVGLLRPDAGSIRLDRHDLVRDPGAARRLCALQPQAQVPITGLSPRQAIELIGRLRGGTATEVRARMTRLVDALDIGQWLDASGERLSGGVKRLTAFCMAAVWPGRLVILDEPTNDVDPVRRRLLWGAVRTLADEGVAVLLVTHNVLEAERSVDRLAILDHGHVIADGTPASLKATVADDLRLDLVLDPASSLDDLPGFLRRPVTTGSHVVIAVARSAARDALDWASEQQRVGRVEEFGLTAANLEDIYVELVGRSDALHEQESNPKETSRVRAA